MTCLCGVHGRADGGNSDADFLAFQIARCEAWKAMTTHSIDDIRRIRAINPSTFFVCRIYEDLNNRIVSSEQFANWQIAQDTSMRRHYAEGVRYFEIANEVNLRQEGMWQSWSNGKQFGDWFLDVCRRLRLAFPGVQLGFPGLSPGEDVPSIRYDANRFWNESKFAMEQADWIGCHAYEVFNTTNRGAGGAWRIVRDLVPNKPLMITEFSSPLQSPQTQATQYRKYYEAMRNEKDVLAAFSFAVSGTHFTHEAWRKENGELTPIPFEVARRNFTTPPTPPMKPLYISRIDRNGANIRNWDGKFIKLIPPNSEIAVYTKPQTIGGWPRRVLVNPQLGYNVLVDRILPPIDLIGVGFDSPVGTPDERAGLTVWPGKWIDANPYGSLYSLGYHTGADLNLNSPNWDTDRDAPVYASADGKVIAAAHYGPSWRNLIVIEHADGVYTRYAHVHNIRVSVGKFVVRGEQIATIGFSGPNGPYHLHFDISPTIALKNNPADWPGNNLARLRADYVDPLEFIRNHRPK